jgi:hypothetical protein
MNKYKVEMFQGTQWELNTKLEEGNENELLSAQKLELGWWCLTWKLTN